MVVGAVVRHEAIDAANIACEQYPVTIANRAQTEHEATVVHGRQGEQTEQMAQTVPMEQ